MGTWREEGSEVLSASRGELMRDLQGSKPTAFHLRSLSTTSQQEIRHGGSSQPYHAKPLEESLCMSLPKPIFDEEVGKRGGEQEERDLEEAPFGTLTPLHPLSGSLWVHAQQSSSE